MHELCSSVSDYVIMVLVVPLLLRGASSRLCKDPTRPCMHCTHNYTHKSPLVFHFLGFGRVIQFCSNCTPRRHPNFRGV